MPSAGEWPKVKKAFETLSAHGQRPMFPLTGDLVKQAVDEAAKAKTGQVTPSTPGSKDSGDRRAEKESLEPCNDTTLSGSQNQSTTEASPKIPISKHMPQSKEGNSTLVCFSSLFWWVVNFQTPMENTVPSPPPQIFLKDD